MEHRRSLGLLDSQGQPIAARIERVLTRLQRRLLRQFPALKDDVLLIDVMEEAARRIALHEERSGPIEKLHGYAWVTLRSVAISQMRRGSIKLIRNSLGAQASQEYLASMPAASGTQVQIDRDILLREALDTLSHDERMICVWKKAGFSSREIARHQRCSVAAVDTLFSRVKNKIRKALHKVSHTDGPPSTDKTKSRDATIGESAQGGIETEDGEPKSGP